MKKILGLIVFSIALSAPTQSCGEKKTNQEEMKTEETQCKATDKCCNATEEQMAGIRKAIDLYVEAAVNGDSKIAEAAFAKTATMSYSDNDTIVSVPIKVLFDYYDNDCPQEASYEISACSVAEDAAIVRIESKFGEAEFSDMFSMVKDGNDWKIVSKIYHLK